MVQNALYKLVCQYGQVQDTFFPIEQLVNLKSTCLDELEKVVLDRLKRYYNN